MKAAVLHQVRTPLNFEKKAHPVAGRTFTSSMASSSRQLGATWAGGSDERPPLSNGGRHRICADWIVGHRCPSDNDQGYAKSLADLRSVRDFADCRAIEFPLRAGRGCRAMRYFYTELGHRIWTDWGFTDAFSVAATGTRATTSQSIKDRSFA